MPKLIELEMIEEYEIRPDVICNYYDGHSDLMVREVLGKILQYNKKDARTSNLYRDMITRHKLESWLDKLPDKDRWLNEDFVTSSCAWEMKRQIESYMDTTDAPVFNLNIYYFYAHTYPHIPPQTAAILNQKIEVSLEVTPEFFKFLFAFIFNRTSKPSQFLTYHLQKSFNGNLETYKLFLLEIQKELHLFIGLGIKLMDEWLAQQKPKRSISALTHREEILKLLFLKESGHIKKLPTATELRTQFGQGRYEASLSLSQAKRRSNEFKPAKKSELENVLRELQKQNFDDAVRLVEKALSEYKDPYQNS